MWQYEHIFTRNPEIFAYVQFSMAYSEISP